MTHVLKRCSSSKLNITHLLWRTLVVASWIKNSWKEISGRQLNFSFKLLIGDMRTHVLCLFFLILQMIKFTNFDNLIFSLQKILSLRLFLGLTFMTLFGLYDWSWMVTWRLWGGSSTCWGSLRTWLWRLLPWGRFIHQHNCRRSLICWDFHYCSFMSIKLIMLLMMRRWFSSDRLEIIIYCISGVLFLMLQTWCWELL